MWQPTMIGLQPRGTNASMAPCTISDTADTQSAVFAGLELVRSASCLLRRSSMHDAGKFYRDRWQSVPVECL